MSEQTTSEGVWCSDSASTGLGAFILKGAQICDGSIEAVPSPLCFRTRPGRPFTVPNDTKAETEGRPTGRCGFYTSQVS